MLFVPTIGFRPGRPQPPLRLRPRPVLRLGPWPGLRPSQLAWLVYALFLLSGVAQAAIVPLLPRLAMTFAFSPSQTALLLALPGLATLAVSVPAGLAADRFGARRVTIAAGGLLCLSCLGQASGSLALLLGGRIAFAAALAYIAVSAVVVRLGERVRTLRFNALATLALAVALGPALTGSGPPALVIALVATALPRAAISTVAYGLASDQRSQPDQGEGSDGFVFGLLNGAWAGAMVLTPIVIGSIDQHDGAQAGFLAVIAASCAIAGWLIGGLAQLAGGLRP